MRYLITFLFIAFSLNSYAVDVFSTTTKKSCYGLFLSIINSNTKYTTFKNLNAPVTKEPSIAQLPSRSPKPAAKIMYSFFNKTIPVEVFDSNTTKPLEKLKEKALYTFVLTKNELRFAETTRRTGAIKNFLSKHFYLSRGEPVFFAGEAWLDEGILVVNHNSGTFRPNPDDLPAIAEYFKKALNIDEVHFSNVLPAPEPFLPVKAYVDRLKGYISSLKTGLSSSVVHFFTKNNYANQTISVGIDGKPGKDIVFEVQDKIGNGFYGVVYNTKIVSVSQQASFKYPAFLENGTPSTHLVVKFPNNVPVLHYFPSTNIFNKAILDEQKDFRTLSAAASDFSNSAADIVFNGNSGKNSFLIKNLVTATSFENVARGQVKLTNTQVNSLEDDIYEMAVTIKKKLNLDLDIKAENLAWDEKNKRFVLYELSVRQSGGFVNNGGFAEYLAYVNVRFQHWNVKRKPSSVDNLMPLRKGDNFILPSIFNKKFSTENGEFVFDFSKSQISFIDMPFNGVYGFDSYIFNDKFSQLVFVAFEAIAPEKKIRFAIRRDHEDDSYTLVYEPVIKNEVIANSIFYKLKSE
jgi:hypothetical protein